MHLLASLDFFPFITNHPRERVDQSAHLHRFRRPLAPSHDRRGSTLYAVTGRSGGGGQA